MGIVRPEAGPASPKSEEEESIEQYMAKLLQRVRGDSAGNATSVAQPVSAPLNAPVANSYVNASIRTAPLPIPGDLSPEAGDTIGENRLLTP
jgi:hypothetical protein